MEQEIISKPTFAEFKPGQEVWIDQWGNLYTGDKGGSSYGNPNERLPVYIEIKDSGPAEIIEQNDQFILFKFSGKIMKGLWALKRESPNSDIWVLSKGMLPGEKINEDMYSTRTGYPEFDFSNNTFPVNFSFGDASYQLVLTKNGKILLNKN